jgi:four helix bundle protein
MRNYRDLQVWKKAHDLTLELYRVSQRFPREEIYGITGQLRRPAVSIGANLAEGCGRRTSAELARFVRIAMGSASELDYHLLLLLRPRIYGGRRIHECFSCADRSTQNAHLVLEQC